MTLKLAIEEAVFELAPEVTSIVLEGLTQPAPAAPTMSGFISLDSLQGVWNEVGELDSLVEGTTRRIIASGHPLLCCRVAGTLYAYETSCPNCGADLSGSRLEVSTLQCAGCRQRFDVIRAGRGLDDPSLHIEPVPLLIDHGRPKVALPVLQV